MPVAALAAIALSGCNGIFAGIYDEPATDSQLSDGFSASPTEPRRLTLTIDASDFGQWNYISLKNKTVEKLPIPLTCEGEWDGQSGITLNQVSGSKFTPLSFTPTDEQPEPGSWDMP